MKYTTSPHKTPSLVAFLLAILFVMAACSEPNNGNGTTTDTLPAPTINITMQPVSVTIDEGSTATLSVTATSPSGAKLSYQWQKAQKGSTDFTNVTDATSASYTTPILAVADSGVQYRVVVTARNDAGLTSTTTSDIATISVSTLPLPAAPIITRQPASDTITEGKTATLSVVVTPVTGVTFTYQWQQAASGSTTFTNIADATSASYTTPPLAFQDNGVTYQVVVTATSAAKLTSTATSDMATITVSALPPAAPIITKQPESQSIKEGSSATLTVVADPFTDATFSYQWQTALKGSTTFVNIEGATSASYTTPTLAVSDSGVQYRVVVTATKANLMSSTTSGIATISVIVVSAENTIVWTHRDGTTQYAAAPANNTLLSEALTSDKTYIKSVDIIPPSVTSIGNNAFEDCTSLTSITIPSTITSIGSDAFGWCKALTSITIPNSVTSMGKGVFYNCTSLTSVTLPNNIPSIGVDAFKFCSALTSITLPNSVTSIGNNAFYDCRGLTSITLPSNVASIGESAFSACIGLTSVTIPSSVTSIEMGAFFGCTALDSVRVEATTPPTAGASLFTNTHATLIIRVPDGSVADYKAAAGWSTYKSRIYGYSDVVSPDVRSAKIVWTDINNVKHYANVPSDGVLISEILTTTKIDIKSVDTIPSDIKSIGAGAFALCTALTSITIPNSVASIGASAFSTTGLTSITIPASVTSIGRIVFSDCSDLVSVRVEATSPPTAGQLMFTGTASTLSITVPAGSLAAYQAAEGWRDYAKKITGY